MKFNDAYSQMFPGCPDAVRLQQAAEMLGLNRHTVGELIRSRRLFALKIGRTYRIPKLSVIEFLLTGQCLPGRAPSRLEIHRWMWFAVGAATDSTPVDPKEVYDENYRVCPREKWTFLFRDQSL